MKPYIPSIYIPALEHMISPPDMRVRRFKKHEHSAEQKVMAKNKKSKRKATKHARRRNRK
jgi:hypothetical protein